MSSLAMK
ncbi:hypothetical protein LINPERHAP2_LOCUS41788 [Linum perenne]